MLRSLKIEVALGKIYVLNNDILERDYTPWILSNLKKKKS